MVDDSYNYENPYAPPAVPRNPGDQGYRLPGWDAGYNPGPNWNNGIAPTPSDPYQNWNNGSPVDAPLQAGYGWEWSGAQTNHPRPWEPVFNSESGNWDYGRWNQVAGRGIGYAAPSTGGSGPGPTGPTNPTSPGPGYVPSANPIKVPGSSLPGDINNLFNTQPAQSPIQSAYQTALLDFMKRSQQTPSLGDPTLAPQVEVYRAQQQRNQERNRRQTVERAAAIGQNDSGFINRKINQGVQEQNFNTAAFNANLLGGETAKRRQELLEGIRLAQMSGNAEAERELRNRLAQASAMMQQQGLNLQGQLGAGDLTLRMLMAMMGNNQFYDQLGINTALNLEGLNQRALQYAGGF